MSSLEDQIQHIQEQLQLLLQRVEAMPHHMQPDEDHAAPLHSLGTRCLG